MKTTFRPRNLPRLALLLTLLALPLAQTLAQAADTAVATVATAATTASTQPEMADTLRQSGKIYVVVASVVVIIAGLLTYLVALDRKATRLERLLKD